MHTHKSIQTGETDSIHTIYMRSIAINSSECGKIRVNVCEYLLVYFSTVIMAVIDTEEIIMIKIEIKYFYTK